MCGEEAACNTDREVRKHAQHETRVDWLPQPKQREHDAWRNEDRRGFRKKRAGEQQKRCEPRTKHAPFRCIDESQIHRETREREQHGLHVLSLGHPRDAFNSHWMCGENRGDPERVSNVESSEDDEEQHGVCRMHQQIDGVVRERINTNECVLNPESSEHQRVVLRCVAGSKYVNKARCR